MKQEESNRIGCGVDFGELEAHIPLKTATPPWLQPKVEIQECRPNVAIYKNVRNPNSFFSL